MIRSILLLAIFVVVFIYLSIMNPQSVTVNFYRDVSYTLPLSFWIVLLVLLGVLIGYFGSLVKLFLLNLKLSTSEKKLKREELNKTHLVEALLDEFIMGSDVALKVVENTKGDAWITLLKGRNLRKLGRVKEALEIHSKLYTLYSSSGHFLREFVEDLIADGRYEEAISILRNKSKDEILPSALYVVMEEAEKRGYYSNAAYFAGILYKNLKLPMKDRIVAYEIMDRISNGDIKGIKNLVKSNPYVVTAGIAALKYLDVKSAQEYLMSGYKRSGNPVFLYMLAVTISDPNGYNPEKIVKFIEENAKEDIEKSILGYAYINLGMYDNAIDLLGSIPKLTVVDLVEKLAAERHGVALENSTIGEIVEVLRSRLFKFRCLYCGSSFYELGLRCENCGRIPNWGIDYGV
ncbi:MAG: tetratricopeptide repeat protein [Thermosulfidibacteraceae bacterium]|jgi:uncharacterized integral membrane protein